MGKTLLTSKSHRCAKGVGRILQNNDYLKGIRVISAYQEVLTIHEYVLHRKIIKAQTYPNPIFC